MEPLKNFRGYTRHTLRWARSCTRAFFSIHLSQYAGHDILARMLKNYGSLPLYTLHTVDMKRFSRPDDFKKRISCRSALWLSRHMGTCVVQNIVVIRAIEVTTQTSIKRRTLTMQQSQLWRGFVGCWAVARNEEKIASPSETSLLYFQSRFHQQKLTACCSQTQPSPHILPEVSTLEINFIPKFCMHNQLVEWLPESNHSIMPNDFSPNIPHNFQLMDFYVKPSILPLFIRAWSFHSITITSQQTCLVQKLYQATKNAV